MPKYDFDRPTSPGGDLRPKRGEFLHRITDLHRTVQIAVNARPRSVQLRRTDDGSHGPRKLFVEAKKPPVNLKTKERQKLDAARFC